MSLSDIAIVITFSVTVNCKAFRYDVVEKLVIVAFSHTGYHMYDNAFNFPYIQSET